MEKVVKERLKCSGVPLIDIAVDNIKGYKKDKAKKFVKDKVHMVVVGEDYYKICARLAHLTIYDDFYTEVRWTTQSMLKQLTKVETMCELFVLVSLFEEPVDTWKSLAGSFINNALFNEAQILIGCESLDMLEKSLCYDVDRIEKEFEIWES